MTPSQLSMRRLLWTLPAAIKTIRLMESAARCPRVNRKSFNAARPCLHPIGCAHGGLEQELRVPSTAKGRRPRVRACGNCCRRCPECSFAPTSSRNKLLFFIDVSGRCRRAPDELRTWVSSMELPKAPNERLALADRLFAGFRKRGGDSAWWKPGESNVRCCVAG